MQQIDLFTAREMLDCFDKHAKDVTAEQQEARDKLEWAINNAHKLQVMFFGRADKSSINDVIKWTLTLSAIWHMPEANNPPRTIH